MTKQIKVAPSILSADFAAMGEAVEKLKEWKADWVHCDVMDGRFVPNLTFGMPMVKALRKHTELPLDVHLMIVEPEKYIVRFLDAGADIVTFHAETCKDVEGQLDLIHSRGKKGGLVLNPDIEISSIEKYLDKVDIVMLMGVFPGFGGQKFILTVLEKISELKSICKDRFLIELDGGVTIDNIREMAERGIDVAVAGSSVFGAKDPAKAVDLIKNCLD